MDMFPAGEMWSVVIESPKIAKMWASLIDDKWGNYFSTLLKKGGSWMYVEFSSQLKWVDWFTLS